MKSLMVMMMVAALAAAGSTQTYAAKADKQAAKTDKQTAKVAARNPKPLPLTADVVKVDGQQVTVRTHALTGPDGLIAPKEKTYDTNEKTTVSVNGETNKKVADLVPGEIVRLSLSEDGKIAEQIDARVVTPADRAAKKAQRQNALAAPTAPPAKTIP